MGKEKDGVYFGTAKITNIASLKNSHLLAQSSAGKKFSCAFCSDCLPFLSWLVVSWEWVPVFIC